MQIEKAHLFDLSTDPREKVNLVEKSGAEGCCPRAAKSAPSNSGAAVQKGEVPASCFEAAQYPASLLKGGDDELEASLDLTRVLTMEVCCHLQTAATVFARDNLEFFGRRGYEQEGEDKKPEVKKPKAKKSKEKKPKEKKPEEKKSKEKKLKAKPKAKKPKV